MTRRRSTLALLATAVFSLGVAAGSAKAELRELKVGLQYGLTFLPFDVMEANKLVEKQAASRGLDGLKVTWARFAGGNVMNDALLSSSIDVAASGLPAFTTLWARAKGRFAVKSLGAYGSSAYVLLSRNPAVKSLRDLSDADRIALNAIKISNQAILLQMGAEKEFGVGQHDRLDRLTVARANPDGMAEFLSGKTEINAHFPVPPYSTFEMMQPGVHVVFNGDEVFGGPFPNGFMYLTQGVYDENPNVIAAFLAAFDEACATIKKDTRAAAELYMAKTGDNKFGIEPILKTLDDPSTRYDRVPRGMSKVVRFMARTKAIAREPASLDEMLFKEAPRPPDQ